MFNTMSKIGWEGGGSTSICIMSLNILGFFKSTPKGAQVPKVGRCQRRLSQKPKFVGFFFEAFPYFGL